MKVILGIGNPGTEYALTRHNVGWWVVDYLAREWRLDGWRKDGHAIVVAGLVNDQRVRLLKPQTFVNASGDALRPYLRKPSWSSDRDLLVIVDDVAIPVGSYRLRGEGSSGGHNGLRSIEAALGSRAYARVRIGIGPAEVERRARPLADFVLDRAGKGERAAIDELMPGLRDAVECWIKNGVEAAMNRFNGIGTKC